MCVYVFIYIYVLYICLHMYSENTEVAHLSFAMFYYISKLVMALDSYLQQCIF